MLARLLRAFIAEYPKVDLTLHSGNTSELVRQLLDGKVSVRLIKGPARDRGVRSESFMEDELVPIAAVDAPADSLSRTGFLQSTLLIREQGSGSRQVVESALKRAGFRLSALKEVMTLDSTEAIKSTVEVGYPDRRFAHNPPYVRATSWRLCPSERVFWATGYSFDFRVVQCGRIRCGLELGTRKAVEIA